MNLSRLQFNHAKVLVLGDIMLDRYWHGQSSRISPEAPVPVVHVGDQQERPGGCGNVALNIAALGAQATVLAVTGDDAAAEVLQTQLDRAAVRCELLRVAKGGTVVKLRVLSRHQQLVRLDFEEPLGAFDRQALVDRYQQLLSEVDVVVLSDYRKGTLDGVQSYIRMAKQAGKTVLVDPKAEDFSCYRDASLLTPNMAEFERMVGVCKNDEDLNQKGNALLAQLNLQALLVTRSEHGMTLLQDNQPAVHLPTQAREVYDVTGAGDTVIAVLAAAIAAGESPVKATQLANTAAGLVVAKLGAATVSVEELRQALAIQKPFRTGIVDLPQLLSLLPVARDAGERIVMTNGCFDILHVGHVSYLTQARALGDRLVVAVNDDASVQRLKGSQRPINTLLDRMQVLASLRCVDWVIPFTEDTPAQLIEKIKPQVLVKGGDYQADKIVGADFVRQYGGEVKILPYIEGASTTDLIATIHTQFSADSRHS